MNAARLIKLAPTLILVAFLAYSSYSMQASLPDPAVGRSELAKGLDIMLQDVLASGAAAADRLSGPLRNPFQVGPQLGAADAAGPKAQEAAPPGSEPDSLAEIVAGLKLDATFIQGRDQIAIIDGRLYSRGQCLLLEGSSGESSPALVLAGVLPTKVILRGGGRSYVLSYPDQLGPRKDPPRDGDSMMSQGAAMAEFDPGGRIELFRRLLDSPLGALGRSVIGAPAKSAHPARVGQPPPAGNR